MPGKQLSCAITQSRAAETVHEYVCALAVRVCRDDKTKIVTQVIKEIGRNFTFIKVLANRLAPVCLKYPHR